MKRRSVIRTMVFVFAALTAAPLVHAWEVVKLNGRDYVTLQSVKQFYRFDSLTRDGNSAKLENRSVVLKVKVGQQDCFMNNVKFVFSYKVEAQGSKVLISRIDLSKLIDPVLRPNYIGGAGNFRTVILDPGHGGKDPGATNSIGTEAGYNMLLAKKLKPLLEQRGFKVMLTRTSNRYLTLQQRVNIANRITEQAIFVSLHFNAGGRHAYGIETFTLSPKGVAHYGRGLRTSDFQARTGNTQDSANIALATAIHGSVLRRLGTNTFDRGIKRARYSVLTGVKHPAILFEGGFMSHPREARLIHNPAYQNALANGISDAVLKYRYAVSGGARAGARQ